MMGESFSLPLIMEMAKGTEEGRVEEGTDAMDEMEGVEGDEGMGRMAEGVTTLDVSLMMSEKMTGDADLGSSATDER